MTPQQKKDADVANMGQKAEQKAAKAVAEGGGGGGKIDKDFIVAQAAKARSIAEGAPDKSKPKV